MAETNKTPAPAFCRHLQQGYNIFELVWLIVFLIFLSFLIFIFSKEKNLDEIIYKVIAGAVVFLMISGIVFRIFRFFVKRFSCLQSNVDSRLKK